MWFIPFLAAALGQAPRVEASELVNRLSATRYADRNAAFVALEVMGAEALPALRAASNSPDPELRTRVESLLAKIRAHDMSRSSLVSLEARERTCDEIVRESAERWPDRLAWHPQTPDLVRRRTISAGEPGPVAFWSAVDRLCRAASLHYIPGSPEGPGSNIAQFRLFLAPGASVCPRSDAGPLRFELTGINYFRSINLIPDVTAESQGSGAKAPRYGEAREDFNVAMRVLVEPRMLISRIGEAVITEAVDDRGQSLLSGDGPDLQPCASGSSPAQACTFFQLSLRHPRRAGSTIKHMKFSLPVEVVRRIPEPLVVELASARGKVFRLGRTALQVLNTKTDQAGRPTLEIKLAMDDEAANQITRAVPLESPRIWGQAIRPEVSDNVLQVFDQHGRQFPWSGAVDFQGTGPTVIARVTLCPDGLTTVSETTKGGLVDAGSLADAVPTRLHYYELAHTVVRANVAFSDISLP